MDSGKKQILLNLPINIYEDLRKISFEKRQTVTSIIIESLIANLKLKSK